MVPSTQPASSWGVLRDLRTLPNSLPAEDRTEAQRARGPAYIYNTIFNQLTLSQQAFIELLLLSGPESDYNDTETIE